jgi:transcriptional regulator GlxA family with amidase domain
MSRWDFRSQDSDEVQDFLGGIYTENEFKIFGKSSPSRTRIHGADVGDIAQYNVSYSSPFTFLSETPRESFLILTCTAGTAKFHRGNDVIEFHAGRTAPISATRESRVESGDSLAHISTHISTEAINSLCSKLLGRPLDEPVLFAHVPFAGELKTHWDLVVKSLGLLLDAEHPPSIAINSLKEYAITLLLEKHSHNYSRYFEQRESADARVVRGAKHFIDQNADRAIAVADVAAFAGCSIRALHEGFCEHLGLTPRAYLYFARLALARSRLTSGGAEGSAAEVAQSCGFVDFGNFGSAYQTRYDENPTDAFQRYFRSTGLESDHSRTGGGLTPAKIDLLRHHVNASLGERITVEKLAAVVCMSPQNFAASFKHAFKTTPAQYVLHERLKWARWLLANTDSSIAAVAAETGFSSQSHLTSSLKSRIGETPHELRKASRLR